MSIGSWSWCWRSFSGSNSTRSRRANKQRKRPVQRAHGPRIELLEDRLVPATLTVNSLLDNITDTSVLTLRDAVALVNSSGNQASLGQSSMPAGWASQISGSFGSNDTIQFDASLLGPTLQTITLGGSDLHLGQNVSITGPGADQLAISGNNVSQVFEVAAGTTDSISGLTIENGYIGSAPYSGGGIMNSGELTVADCTVNNNVARQAPFGQGYGGGIANSGTLLVSGSTFSGNTAASYGGGIYNAGTLTVTDSSLFINNWAFAGGGLADLYGGTITVIDSTLSGNGAGWYGAGIYNGGGTLTVIGSTLNGGQEALYGGGIYNLNGTVIVSGSTTISGNSASEGGGVDNYGALQVTDSTISGNSTGPGSDINDFGTLTLSNSDVPNIKFSSTTILLFGSAPSYLGQPVSLTARVDPSGYSMPTGTVTFWDGSTALGTVAINNTGTPYYAPNNNVDVNFTTADLALGVHPITATYSGDFDHLPSSTILSNNFLPDTITTVAGNFAARPGYSGDGGSATAAAFDVPEGIAIDAAGDLFIADLYNHVVRKVTPAGVITTVAGTFTGSGQSGGGYSGDGGPATAALLNFPFSIAVDAAGDLFIVDLDNDVIREVDSQGIITTIAGNGTSGYSGDGGLATAAQLFRPSGIAVDGAGDLFIADGLSHVVRKVDAQGIITTIAGDGTAGYSGDGGPATSAQLDDPNGIAVDAYGDLFIADYNDNVVREVSSNGVIFTVAGNGTAGYVNGWAAELNGPVDVALDSAGNLFIADFNNNAIREMSLLGGPMYTVAGNTTTAGYSGDGGPAYNAQLNGPSSIRVTDNGIFIADSGNNVIREVNPAVVILPVPPATTTTYLNYVNYTNVNPSAFGQPVTFTAYVGSQGVVQPPEAPTGTVTFYDSGVAIGTSPLSYDAFYYGLSTFTTSELGVGSHVITAAFNSDDPLYASSNPSTPFTQVVNQAQTSTIISASAAAGTPIFGQSVTYTATISVTGPGAGMPTGTLQFVVDGQKFGFPQPLSPAGTASFTTWALAVGPHSILALYSGDANFLASAGVLPGTISTVADVSSPFGVAVDAAGDVFVADTFLNIIEKVTPDGCVSIFAGVIQQDQYGQIVGGYSGDGGPAAAAQLNFPRAIAFDANGDLFIADSGNNVIREINPAGVISTVAGSFQEDQWGDIFGGYSGDGGAATAAQLNGPMGIAVDAKGNLFIADSSNEVIRKVNPKGIISTIAGTQSQGYSGDGGPATSAQLYFPTGVAVNAAGDLLIADVGNNAIRRVKGGVITTVAGNGVAGYSGDGGPASAASLSEPIGIVFDAYGDLFIADTNNQVIREISSAGLITTVAGNVQAGPYGFPLAGYSGDGGPATAGQLAYPAGVAVDAAGNLFIADAGNNVIREVSPPLVVGADTPANLQQALATTSALTLQAATDKDVHNIINAVNGLPSFATNPVTVTLNLAAGVYSDLKASPPPGVTLVIKGSGASVVGKSPALAVTSGTVIVSGLTLSTATDSPTIRVTGGTVILRNDTVQESPGFANAAIVVTGGLVDLGTTADLGNNVLIVNGTGLLIRNTGSNPISALGDTFEKDGVVLISPYRIEDLIVHALDGGGNGLVTYVANNVYVSGSKNNIQRGVDAVASGGTVDVESTVNAHFTVGNKLVTVSFQNGPSLGLQADPLIPGEVMLVVSGTPGDDTIRIVGADDDPNSLKVKFSDQDMGNFRIKGAFAASLSRIVVFGLAGNDDIKVNDEVTVPAWLYGGDGNDRLKGGSGPSLLLGGSGDDLLAGGSNRDILIGGDGADHLVGNGGDDLLIGGYTSYDANDTALSAIMAEWTSAHDFATRVANLADQSSSPTFANRLNGNYFLLDSGAGQTVFNDSGVDTLEGDAGADWFFTGAADKLSDLTKSDIDFIFS
jgi:Bacterial Ig-like domain (group 3)/RTX calcium-binding nonapeptide repeat (4 copies)/NHL repeat